MDTFGSYEYNTAFNSITKVILNISHTSLDKLLLIMGYLVETVSERAKRFLKATIFGTFVHFYGVIVFELEERAGIMLFCKDEG